MAKKKASKSTGTKNAESAHVKIIDDFDANVDTQPSAVPAGMIQNVPSSREVIDRILHTSFRQCLERDKIDAVYRFLSQEYQAQLRGSYKIRNTPAVAMLMKILGEEGNLRDFVDRQPYCRRFKQECGNLGLAADFDRTEKNYPISLPLSYSGDHRLPGNLEIRRKLYMHLHDLSCPDYFNNMPGAQVEAAFRTDLEKTRERMKKLAPLHPDFLTGIEEYFKCITNLARYRHRRLVEKGYDHLANRKEAEAANLVLEIYQDKIGNEIIALEDNRDIRMALGIYLDEILMQLREEFSVYMAGGKSTEEASGRRAEFSLSMDQRDANSIVSGMISSDCTDIRHDFSFHETIPQHLFDPGFLRMRLLDSADKWVGNVYMVVMKKEERPILVIDAVQTNNENYIFPVSVFELSDAMVGQAGHYGEEMGFDAVYLSSFLSNRGFLSEYLNRKYSINYENVAKVGGFEHLVELGLWDPRLFRNEYIETLMPGNPNSAIQTNLPLRLVRKIK